MPNPRVVGKRIHKLVCHQPSNVVLVWAVKNARQFVKYWLPVVFWMGLIFTGSGDSHSFQHSSRLIEPVVRFLFPNIAPETLNSVVVFFRKCAHLTEYAILALLFWRALRKPQKSDTRPWSGKLALSCIGLVALYAASDEFHQSFVPSREASLRDVLIDTTGATLGMGGLWSLGRLRKRW